MQSTAERSVSHIGETCGAADHDHDLIHDLGKRLDGLWHYDQYIANAKGHTELEEFWKTLKDQEQRNIAKLKELVKGEIKKGCF